MTSEDDELIEIPRPKFPYPGLRPFEEDEWPLFFGREAASAEVAERLLKQRLVLVHGSSGCGKSSLVRAGVLPRLAQIHEGLGDGNDWKRCAMRPGDAPLRNLAHALSAILGKPDPERTLSIRRALDQGRQGLGDLCKILGCSPTSTVCIVVDQFEEIFRYARGGGWDEVGVLADLLIGIEKERRPGLMVLVTMRSDFLGDCARITGLAETFNRTQYLLPRMSRGDLLRAIQEPALMYDGRVTRDLAERLITDANVAEDELPLVQHVLLRLWTDAPEVVRGERREKILELGQYSKGGDLSRHLTAHAESVGFPPGAAPDREPIVRKLFQALTDVNAEKQAIRRPIRYADLRRVLAVEDAPLRAVIDDFRADGVSFLTPYEGAPVDTGTMIDISHEALARRWTRIADPETGWLELEFRDGQRWRSILVQSAAFRRNQRALLSEAVATETDAWCKDRNEAWAERYGGDWAGVQALVAASVARAKVSRLLRRGAIAVIALLALASGWLAVSEMKARHVADEQANWAMVAKQLAEDSRVQADAAADTAKKAKVLADTMREAALEDAARQSELNDVRSVQLALDTLFPVDADSEAKAVRLQASARAAVGRLTQRIAERDALRCTACSHSEASYEFTDPADTARHRVLTEFVHDAGVVAEPEKGALAILARRFARATKDDTTALWTKTIAEIANKKENPKYQGLSIEPVYHLYPLGKDPDSGLFEFAHLYSGTLPVRGEDERLVPSPTAAIVFVLIPVGVFPMGASTSGKDNVDTIAQPNEGPVHEVKVTPFFLSKYECTQSQWNRLTGRGKSSKARDAAEARRKGLPKIRWDEPVTNVSWDECAGEGSWLPRYEIRLPSEAQWEYACRAGRKTRYWRGEEEVDLAKVGWYSVNSGGAVHGAGEKPANPWGLFDTHGNVSEWCEDTYHENYKDAPSDSRAWIEGGSDSRLFRGGVRAFKPGPRGPPAAADTCRGTAESTWAFALR